jgi:hypothetical protein
MPHRSQQPSQAEIRLQQAFPTSTAVMAAVNPRPMEQLSKTVAVVPSSSSKVLKHSASSSLLKQRSNESIGFFAKLASRRGSSASSAEGFSHAPLYTPLEWSCRGSLDDEALLLEEVRPLPILVVSDH